MTRKPRSTPKPPVSAPAAPVSTATATINLGTATAAEIDQQAQLLDTARTVLTEAGTAAAAAQVAFEGLSAEATVEEHAGAAVVLTAARKAVLDAEHEVKRLMGITQSDLASVVLGEIAGSPAPEQSNSTHTTPQDSALGGEAGNSASLTGPDGMLALDVTGPRKGRWRAGFFFGPEARSVLVDEDGAELIFSDPLLSWSPTE